MSNRRKSDLERTRYQLYLRSAEWAARRRLWYANNVKTTRRATECGVCASRRRLELHHLDYRGVTRAGTRWVAAEAHADLIALCRLHHEVLHRALDTDPGYSMTSRKIASLRIIARHRTRLIAALLELVAPFPEFA